MLREDASLSLREAVRWVKKFPTEGEDLVPGGNLGIYSKGLYTMLKHVVAIY